MFLVATNNYRAHGGGGCPGLDGSNVVIDAPDENRQVLIDHLAQVGRLDPGAPTATGRSSRWPASR